MKSALIGGESVGIEQVRAHVHDVERAGARRARRSGRCSLAGVFGNAKPAPLTRPPPGTPNFPASAGRAKIARMPLPPFWLRSSPLPTLMEAGESVWYHSASWRICASGTRQIRAASATE